MNDNCDLAKLTDSVSQNAVSAWPYDKYPDMPRLTAHSVIALLETDGPGVVTCIHATRFMPRGGLDFNKEPANELIVRVFYDNETVPSIEMPWHDFVFDLGAKSNFFSLGCVSKVHRANNFRLPMPFRKHIRITLQNPTDRDMTGYADVQWDRLSEFPDDMGYLYAEYRSGALNIPFASVELCNIKGQGKVVGQWLLLTADDPICKNGELLCEANNEFYLDGASVPSLEYLGTEDLYGFSWGFEQLESDGVCAILRKEETKNGGSVIGLARMRTADAISFQKSCRYIFTYEHEINPALPSLNPNIKRALDQNDVKASFESCVYYYKK
ncbi:MAG TPA: DUF2961 domain-containing protein [Oscillospiraceae bacterium]|nr:DUF2961 domain-containing protein [Oscillospiraceae bacterium]HPK36191.1 DUF2961 domain-containing protein [Oscillospiraceae bacterium]HPR75682.1 DUF2961 domain-containing protein [Oscillospiraceae bacterium]